MQRYSTCCRSASVRVAPVSRALKGLVFPMSISIFHKNTRKRRGTLRGCLLFPDFPTFLLQLAAPGLLLPGCSQPAESLSDEHVGEVSELLAPGSSASGAPAYPPPGLRNIAYNPSCSGYPNTSETDRTWGCTNTCDLLDGLHAYDSWCHGHAFTGGTTTHPVAPRGLRRRDLASWS